MAGRPKGSKSKVDSVSSRLKKIAKKILEGKANDETWKTDPTITQEEFHWRSLLEVHRNDEGKEATRDREIRLRALGMLSDRLRGKPTDSIEHSGKIAGGGARVVVLPEKRSEKDWEAKYGRKEEPVDKKAN